jgi:hypothetical protein
MKSILIDGNNIVRDIADAGTEFETHKSLTWTTTETEVTREGIWELQDDGSCIDLALEEARTPLGAFARFEKARQVSYGDVGAQLGMLYDDMKNGTTTWVDKIDEIKVAVPKMDKPLGAPTPSSIIPPVKL